MNSSSQHLPLSFHRLCLSLDGKTWNFANGEARIISPGPVTPLVSEDGPEILLL